MSCRQQSTQTVVITEQDVKSEAMKKRNRLNIGSQIRPRPGTYHYCPRHVAMFKVNPLLEYIWSKFDVPQSTTPTDKS